MLAWIRAIYRWVDERAQRIEITPQYWESDVRLFDEKRTTRHEPDNAVVFVGGSSIRYWSTIHVDLAPMPVIARGFGGARMRDIVHFARRLVVAENPRAIVVFAGSNDFYKGSNVTPEQLLAEFDCFLRTIQSELPQVPVFFISITPSLMRWCVWHVASEANKLIERYMADSPQLHYIDVASHLLDDKGLPVSKNYRLDGLHLSKNGYRIWSQIIKKALTQKLNDCTYADNHLC